MSDPTPPPDPAHRPFPTPDDVRGVLAGRARPRAPGLDHRPRDGPRRPGRAQRRRHGQGRAHHRGLPAARPDRHRRPLEGRGPARRRRGQRRVRRDDPGRSGRRSCRRRGCARRSRRRPPRSPPRPASSRSAAARVASASRRSPRTSPPRSRRAASTVGVLDADIWGFSIPRMLGVKGRLAGAKTADGKGKIAPERGAGRRRPAARRVDGAARRRRGHRARCGAG